MCFRKLDAIAVVDLGSGRIEWLQKGPWLAPHQPTVVDDGRILVFDNMGNQGFSRVVAFDVPKRIITWQYSTTPPKDFFSIFSGAASRLANGNVLVTESCQGHAFEVTARTLTAAPSAGRRGIRAVRVPSPGAGG